jgi:hypothetical protein
MTTSSGTDAGRRRATAGTAVTIATLLLVSTLTMMAGATVSPALPAIEAAFAGPRCWVGRRR